jgi:hypothetical protein
MAKVIKFVLLGLIVVFVLIQFVPNKIPDNSTDLANDLIQTEEVPLQVQVILKKACYDCHSNQTKFPWYTKVAPSSWLVAKDVREGREEMNLSEWSKLSKRKKIRALSNIAEEVEKRKMPMEIYTVIHRNAILTDEEIKTIIDWTDAMSVNLLGKN